MLLITKIPVTHWERKARLVFNPQSLPDLTWLEIADKTPCIDGQVCKPSSKALMSKTLLVCSSDNKSAERGTYYPPKDKKPKSEMFRIKSI